MSSKLNDTQLVLLSAASQPYEAWEAPNEARVSDARGTGLITRPVGFCAEKRAKPSASLWAVRSE